MSAVRLLDYLEAQPVHYAKPSYVSTKRLNRVSRESVLCGSEQIEVLGRTIIEPLSLLRGDLGPIAIGSHCLIGSGAVLRPCTHRTKTGSLTSLPLSIGDYVRIGTNTVVEAASIASHTIVGDNAIIGKRCVISAGVVIDNGSVVTDQCVCPPLTRWAGNPAVIVDKLPESFPQLVEQQAKTYFRNFLPAAAGQSPASSAPPSAASSPRNTRPAAAATTATTTSAS